MSDLCRPLHRLNITYFSHVHIDNDNQFSALSNNPDFSKHYLLNEYYDADLHLAQTEQLGQFVIWDALEQNGKSAKLYQEASEFGVKHTFSLIEKGNTGTHYYHFATHLIGQSMNQVYLSHIDLLKMFILYFKDKVSQSKTLSQGYNMKFSVNMSASDDIENTISLAKPINRSDFLNEIPIKHYSPLNGLKSLSFREMQILAWLHYGKTADEIAIILNIAVITVKKHIVSIKNKTSCYTQFQLGEFFSELFNHSPELIDCVFEKSSFINSSIKSY